MKRIVMGMIFLSPIYSLAQNPAAEKKITVTPLAHFRTFWMSTSYPNEFKDDYSLGASLSMGAKLTFGSHWSLESSYRGFVDIWSSDIWEKSPITGWSNRYEIGLYDLLNPGNRVFGSFEKLNLRYTAKSWKVALGRMDINTPWVNPQDGRLSPTLMEGASVSFQPQDKWTISAWFIDRLRVRGTSRWTNPGESVGIFPVARDPNGMPSQYFGNTTSKWITIVQLTRTTANGKISLSQTQAHNISSTFWSEWTQKWKTVREDGNWISGIQAGYQSGVGEGGNEDPALRYKDPQDKNWLLSARMGFESKRWITHLNFTKTGGKGRWLNPREWGKDPWFTFIPRERNEGYENFESLVFYLAHNFPKSNLTVYGHAGINWLPDITDAAANKYAFPSYRQVNLGFRWQATKWEKLDFHLLIMNKEAINSPTLSPDQQYNKVGMIHVNGILNWRLN